MNPYWMAIEGMRLAIIPRPRGGDWLEDDIGLLRRAGADVLISALTATENNELGLVDENKHCQTSRLKFVSFPIEDRSVPSSFGEFNRMIDSVTNYLDSGKAVVVHCRAGIGRSSIIVGAALIRRGLSADLALKVIETARGCSVPDTPDQREWLEGHCSEFREGYRNL